MSSPHPRKLDESDYTRIAELLVRGRAQGLSVARIFFDHLDGPDPLLASIRTFYRINAQLFPALERRRRPATPVRGVPIVTADRPGQVLCWDITWLPGSFVTKGFHLYTVLDLYSRKVVGWTVQHRQEKTIATRLIEQVIADQELNGHSVDVVHTDNGKVMTSHMMKAMLDERGVQLSLIRPNVSNDNPFEESSHRTIKHHRYALETYDDIQHAQKVIGRIIDEYNNRDRHSGLNGYTPSEVYSGTWRDILEHRREKETVYYATHPHRRPRKSVYKPPPKTVGINNGKPLAPETTSA